VLLRTAAGNWGQARLLGPPEARKIVNTSLGLDGSGRVVALWDDAGPSSSSPDRPEAAPGGGSPSGTHLAADPRRPAAPRVGGRPVG
jgi:hypothetical protein